MHSMTDTGCEWLCRNLKDNNSLTHLDVSRLDCYPTHLEMRFKKVWYIQTASTDLSTEHLIPSLTHSHTHTHTHTHMHAYTVTNSPVTEAGILQTYSGPTLPWPVSVSAPTTLTTTVSLISVVLLWLTLDLPGE